MGVLGFVVVAAMSPVGAFGPACCCGCGRPARELAGYATSCWLALTTCERRLVTWLVEQEECDQPPPTPLDALEALWDLPASEAA